MPLILPTHLPGATTRTLLQTGQKTGIAYKERRAHESQVLKTSCGHDLPRLANLLLLSRLEDAIMRAARFKRDLAVERATVLIPETDTMPQPRPWHTYVQLDSVRYALLFWDEA